MFTKIIFSFIIAVVLTFIGLYWIDFLYKMPNAPLSFPNEIKSRSKFRKPGLIFILTICILKLSEVPAPINFYFIAGNS